MNETQSVPQKTVTRGHVIINSEECKGCELCIASCPPKVLYLTDRFNTHGYHPSAYREKAVPAVESASIIVPNWVLLQFSNAGI